MMIGAWTWIECAQCHCRFARLDVDIAIDDARCWECQPRRAARTR